MDYMFDLTGRIALVTGGGFSIGRSICEGLPEFGALFLRTPSYNILFLISEKGVYYNPYCTVDDPSPKDILNG